MIVLCDTCVILMLLRIAPDMFNNEEFGCITVQAVWKEFTKTQKFKSKYPWRKNLKNQIKSKPNSEIKKDSFDLTYSAIKMTNNSSNNTRNNKKYGLSPVDCEIAAIAVHNEFSISTTDRNLREFIEQQYEMKNYEPLELINIWLGNKLIEWDDHKQAILDDWIICGEKYPSRKHTRIFQKITGYKFPK